MRFATLLNLANGLLIQFLSNGWLPPSHTQYGLIQFLTFWQDVQLFSILLGIFLLKVTLYFDQWNWFLQSGSWQSGPLK